MTDPSSHAALDIPGRFLKAEKIQRLLVPVLAGRRGLRLLEIGTGSGGIAHFFATRVPEVSRVVAVDVRDQRTTTGPYDFIRYDGHRLPFEDQAFDIVVSNHVIEHVGGRVEQAVHLREIARVLDERGCGYLASPSRWQFIEPHFRLAGLSWLPRRWRDRYLRLAGRGDAYDCDPLSHRELERMIRLARLGAANINAEALSIALCLEPRPRPLRAVLRLAVPVLRAFHRLSPTMVYRLARARTTTVAP